MVRNGARKFVDVRERQEDGFAEAGESKESIEET